MRPVPLGPPLLLVRLDGEGERMSANLAPVPNRPQRPSRSSADGLTTRQRLAERSHYMEERHPEALDDEAALLRILQQHLTGETGLYHASGVEEHGRAEIRGDEHLRVATLLRMRHSARPAGRRAYRAAVDYLSSLEREGTAVELHEAIAGLLREAGEAGAVIVRLAADGEISPEDVATGERELDDVAREIERMRSALRARVSR